jgi:hypothetical protein
MNSNQFVLTEGAPDAVNELSIPVPSLIAGFVWSISEWEEAAQSA